MWCLSLEIIGNFEKVLFSQNATLLVYLLSGNHLLFHTEQLMFQGILDSWRKPSEQTTNHCKQKERNMEKSDALTHVRFQTNPHNLMCNTRKTNAH